MFRQWSLPFLALRCLKRLRIGVQPVARNESSRTFFYSPSSSYWRTPGTSRKQASLIRHSGLDGRNCFENTTIAMACVVYGGQLVSTGIRQSFKNSFRKQGRRTNSAALTTSAIYLQISPNDNQSPPTTRSSRPDR